MRTEATLLERKLVARIEREGPITFRDFMHAALYDSELGYYNTERLKIGPEGDYYTSSNIHAAFGAMLARQFAELWLDSVEPLKIVEIGAGTGQLACDIISAIRDEYPAVFERLAYLIVETSPAMLGLQKVKLAAFDDRIQWCELEELERAPFVGIAFSNEFVDALPVHRIRFAADVMEEQFVVTSAETKCLALRWDNLSNKRFGEYVERTNLTPKDGQIIEINLDAIDWLARMARAVRYGFLVTIDYGDIGQHLYARDRRCGTLRSFHGHRLIDSPLERIGEQDITASVNFTALVEYGRDCGFEVVSHERQALFLTRLGLIERIAATHGKSDSVDDLKDRLAVKNLFVPGSLSDSFRVLIQRKVRNE